ncbi:MAG: leucyl/phenylalanyl-tRNA--protein transferase [Defluviitaleaceae bacterium]|nr:leucyl/phenylalanyl-tRNA--protein transferase [Defluviitaleaceae bacterium]
MPVFELSKTSNLFPPTGLADYDGLLAFGGDLSVERLLSAYSNGIFPWFNPDDPILWWCPKERFVIFPNEIHISQSMRKLIARGNFQTKINTDFSLIIAACKNKREGETWITDDMEIAYNRLFDAGFAGCAGVYENDKLVGGLYGVILGRCFFGESMFSDAANASKIALIRLCQDLAAKNFYFIDCQFHTPHLESMGGKYIGWSDYRRLLREGIAYR